MTLSILRGPTRVIRERPAGLRWCFAERKRLPHTRVVLDYEKDSPHLGWYEPVVMLRCSGCGKDRTHFGDGR